jgi:hypothetical protein
MSFTNPCVISIYSAGMLQIAKNVWREKIPIVMTPPNMTYMS